MHSATHFTMFQASCVTIHSYFSSLICYCAIVSHNYPERHSPISSNVLIVFIVANVAKFFPSWLRHQVISVHAYSIIIPSSLIHHKIMMFISVLHSIDNICLFSFSELGISIMLEPTKEIRHPVMNLLYSLTSYKQNE